MGMKDRNRSREKKLKSSRKAIGMTRGLINDDYMHVYNHF